MHKHFPKTMELSGFSISLLMLASKIVPSGGISAMNHFSEK
jgi:hypothetical protein